MEQLWASITGDLRLALLAAGAVFLLLLVGWEMLQRRRARRADDSHVSGPYGQPRGGAGAVRDPLLDNDDGFVEGVGPVREVPLTTAAAPGAVTNDGRREPTVTLPGLAPRDRLPEPRVVDIASAVTGDSAGRGLPVVDSVTLSDEPSHVSIAPPASIEPEPSAVPERSAASEPPVAPEPAAAPGPAVPSAPRPSPPPADQERRIIALRVVARHGERFTGTSLRQALQGEGFVHGDMQIFHRLSGDGRPLLSAASLTRPGSFDLATMDSALFRGLNLFAVLPGPLSGRETVDKLLLSGHTIAQRLRGELLDSRGEALTEVRLAEMRREASAGDPV